MPVALIVAPASPPIDSRSISSSPSRSRSAVSTVSAVSPPTLTGPALTSRSRSRSAKRLAPSSLTNSEAKAASPSTSSASAVELQHGGRPGVARLPAVELAAERRGAEDQFEIVEALPLGGQVDLGAESRQPAAAGSRRRHPSTARPRSPRAGRPPAAASPRSRTRRRSSACRRPPASCGRAASRPSDFTVQPPSAGSADSLHVADRRVAGHDRRQVDLDAARESSACGRSTSACSQRREPLGERQAAGLFLGADRLVEAHLRAVRVEREARLGAKIDEARALGRIGIVERAGLEAESSTTDACGRARTCR